VCGVVNGNITINFPRCRDPLGQPRPAELANCSALVVTGVGDGKCDGEDAEWLLNSAECTWDGGDCCAQVRAWKSNICLHAS
jgi:hypothetical protein